MYFKIIW